MKNQSKQKLTVAIALTITHNVMFWNNNLGINALLFSGIVIGILAWLNALSFKQKNVLVALAGTIISGILVVLYGSTSAKFAHISSLIILVGFVHANELKNILYALVAVFESFIKIPTSFKNETLNEENVQNNNANIGRKIRLSIIPILFLILFYWIYKLANSEFDRLSSNFWNTVGDNLAYIFQDFSFGRFMFAMLGFVISMTIVFKAKVYSILGFESTQQNQLIRNKPKVDKSKREINTFFNSISLKSENQSAILMVGLINALLLIVNCIDINWIWFNFDVKSVQNLSQFVHEGTYLLIASILLSMGIIEYFFRKNLNFYIKSKILKTLCFVWISQNIVMVISVALRNYHYIAQHGLAYKRIGVIFFLLLTIVGLISQINKIKTTKSGYYMLRINSWATYFTMILIACFNWDIIIANHNLNHSKKENIDYVFLLELSPKTLPILLKNKDAIGKDLGTIRNHPYNIFDGQAILQQNTINFIKDYESRSWLSWNYADYVAYQELKRDIRK